MKLRIRTTYGTGTVNRLTSSLNSNPSTDEMNMVFISGIAGLASGQTSIYVCADITNDHAMIL